MLIIMKNNTKLSSLFRGPFRDIEVNNLLAVVRWGWGWSEEKTKKNSYLKICTSWTMLLESSILSSLVPGQLQAMKRCSVWQKFFK